tara:strand:+ start:273 stop:401 length:129 start_codon:yes stop_codon:yes gene_type:complete
MEWYWEVVLASGIAAILILQAHLALRRAQGERRRRLVGAHRG